VRVLRVLCEVRDGLVEVAPPVEAMRGAELLDMELIKQQADAGIWTWASCHELVKSVVTLIQRAQSPTRDEQTRTRWVELQVSMDAAVDEEKPVVLCRGVEFLLNRVNALRIDAANARLRLIAPVIRNSGVEYEQGKFSDKFKSGEMTLERTEAGFKVDGIATAREVHLCAIVGLITSDEPLRKEVCAETLLMDCMRINEYQKDFAGIVRSSTLAALLLSKVGQEKIGRVMGALASDGDITRAAETVLGGEMTPAIGIAIEQCSDKANPVHQLMRKRVVGALKSAKVEGFNDAVVPLVKELVKKVGRLIQVNGLVHGAIYDKLFALASGSAGSGSVSGSPASGSAGSGSVSGSAASGSGSVSGSGSGSVSGSPASGAGGA
jgi:hypothetical protein